MDSRLAAIIKKQSRPRLIASVILIIAALAVFFYYRSFIQSKTVGADTVSTIAGIMEHFESGDTYITIHADTLYIENLVVETKSTENGRITSVRNTSFFVTTYIEESMLLAIELPYRLYEDESFSFEDVVLTGKLKASTSDFDVIGELAVDLAEEFDIPRSMVTDELLIPVYLDTLEDSTAIMLTILGLIVFVFALITLLIHLIRTINPRSHRVYRQMRRLGDAERIEATLESEIADNSTSIIAHPSNYDYLTSTFILSLEKGKLTIGKTEEIVWAYRRDVKNRGVTTHFIVLRMKDGKSRRTMTAKTPNDAERAMESIFNTLPILCGYSADLDKLYSKKQSEFQNLLNARRADFNAVPEPDAAPEPEPDTEPDVAPATEPETETEMETETAESADE